MTTYSLFFCWFIAVGIWHKQINYQMYQDYQVQASWSRFFKGFGELACASILTSLWDDCLSSLLFLVYSCTKIIKSKILYRDFFKGFGELVCASILTSLWDDCLSLSFAFLFLVQNSEHMAQTKDSNGTGWDTRYANLMIFWNPNVHFWLSKTGLSVVLAEINFLW